MVQRSAAALLVRLASDESASVAATRATFFAIAFTVITSLPLLPSFDR